MTGHNSVLHKFLLFATLSLLGCSKSEKYFLFPKHELIRNSTIEEFGKKYPVRFFNYYGFTSGYNDPILDTFLIHFKSEKQLMFDVSKPDEISDYFKEKITGFRFGIIPKDKISFDSLIQHLLELYPGSRTVKDKDVYFLEHSKYGRILNIEYANTGIGGYFINLLPISNTISPGEQNAQKGRELQYKEDSIGYKEYTLKIKTAYYNDSVSKDEPNLFAPVCLRQDIFFLKKGRVVKHENYKVKIINQKLTSGIYMNMPVNVITDIGVIEGKGGGVFTINGFGGCNSCSELYSIYSPDGELLYCLYQEGGTEYKNIGNLSKVLAKFSISEKDYGSGNYRKKEIYSNL